MPRQFVIPGSGAAIGYHTSVPRSETRSSFELFILALLGTGVDTTYRLREQAGVSVGAAVPALGRLGKQGLIRRQIVGTRGKTRFTLTSAGRKALDGAFAELLTKYSSEPPSDMESLLRLVALAAHRRSTSAAIRLLRLALAARRAEAKGPLPPLPARAGDLAGLYRWLESTCRCERRQAEARCLAALPERLRSWSSLASRGRRRH